MNLLNKVYRGIRGNPYLLLVMIFSFLLIWMNYVWIRKDVAPPPWDPAWYLETSQNLYHSLVHDGVFGFLKSLMHAFNGSKAPLISFLPLPFYLIFGNSEMAAMFVNFSFLILLSYFLFRLVEYISNKRAAFLSVLVVQTMPLFIGMNRQFWSEYGLATLVVIFLYFLVKSDGFRNKKFNVWMGIVLGLGLLMKILFPLYVFFPVLGVIYLRKRSGEAIFVRVFFLEMFKILFIGFLVSSIWYVPNIKSVVSFAVSAGVGDIASHYGSSNVFSWGVVSGYWALIIDKCLSPYYFWLAVFSGLFCVVYYFVCRKRREIVKSGDGIVLLLWFLIPFLVFTFGVNKDYRYVLPFLPVIAIFVGLVVSRLFLKIKNDVIYIFVVGLMVLVPVFTLWEASFADDTLPRDFKTVFIPDERDWRGEEIIEYVYRETYKMDNPSSWSLVALEHSAVNFNTYNYIASLRDYTYPIGFGNLGFTQDDFNTVLSAFNYLSPSFVVVEDGIDSSELVPWANLANDEVRQMMESGKLPYVQDKVFELSHGVKITLFRRVNNK